MSVDTATYSPAVSIIDGLDGFMASPHSDVAEFRRKALDKLSACSFPSKKDEEWRFTDLKPITRSRFQAGSVPGKVDTETLKQYFVPEASEYRFVFVDGVLDTSASLLPETDKLSFSLLSTSGWPAGFSGQMEISEIPEDAFTHMHYALLGEVLFLEIPDEAVLSTPIHILNIYTNTTPSALFSSRVMYKGARFSEASILEEHFSLSEGTYFTIPFGQFFLDDNAKLKHIRILRDSKQAVHVSRPTTYLRRHAEYHSYTFAFGAGLFRNEPLILQLDEEVDFTIDGLVMINGKQVSDTHSAINQAKPYATSHQLHKVVVDGDAHSIFNGKIFVRKDAQKIDAFQENRNILLSKSGKINTKPQLEIFADDVRCSHGATIGQLSDEELFYLQSRGLSSQKAKELLVCAFAQETLDPIFIPSVNERLMGLIMDYTKGNI